MSRATRLAVVVEVVKREVQQAAEQLAKAQASVNAEAQRLAELNAYYQEYAASNGAIPGGRTPAITASGLMAHREFLSRLSAAVESQKHQLAAHESALFKAREKWHRTHMKEKNLTDYVQRLERDENKQKELREEREIADALQSRRRSLN